MKTSEYWKNRFTYLEELQNKKSSSFYKELEEAYIRACNNIEKEILGFYGKYAKNNNVKVSILVAAKNEENDMRIEIHTII